MPECVRRQEADAFDLFLPHPFLPLFSGRINLQTSPPYKASKRLQSQRTGEELVGRKPVSTASFLAQSKSMSVI